jgi:hypothetical protein
VAQAVARATLVHFVSIFFTQILVAMRAELTSASRFKNTLHNHFIFLFLYDDEKAWGL